MAGFAYLIRHAKAGDRDAWEQPDVLRPLSRSGERQAEAIADLFGDEPIARVHSSPAVRCVQTVHPLAVRLGLLVREEELLQEGGGPSGAYQLARSAADDSAESSLTSRYSACRIRRNARARFSCCERLSSAITISPVGGCRRRTAELVLFRF